MRDITYSLDEHWLPQDCFVRISVDDKFMGSGWFYFGDDYAECEADTLLEGRVSQKMQTQGRLKTFQNHAIACDAWHLRLFDQSKTENPQNIGEMLLSSPDHRGATGPMLFSITSNIEFVGQESITVKAGTFDNLNLNRQSLFNSIPNFITKSKNIFENKSTNQICKYCPWAIN